MTIYIVYHYTYPGKHLQGAFKSKLKAKQVAATLELVNKDCETDYGIEPVEVK